LATREWVDLMKGNAEDPEDPEEEKTGGAWDYILNKHSL